MNFPLAENGKPCYYWKCHHWSGVGHFAVENFVTLAYAIGFAAHPVDSLDLPKFLPLLNVFYVFMSSPPFFGAFSGSVRGKVFNEFYSRRRRRCWGDCETIQFQSEGEAYETRLGGWLQPPPISHEAKGAGRANQANRGQAAFCTYTYIVRSPPDRQLRLWWAVRWRCCWRWCWCRLRH